MDLWQCWINCSRAPVHQNRIVWILKGTICVMLFRHRWIRWWVLQHGGSNVIMINVRLPPLDLKPIQWLPWISSTSRLEWWRVITDCTGNWGRTIVSIVSDSVRIRIQRASPMLATIPQELTLYHFWVWGWRTTGLTISLRFVKDVVQTENACVGTISAMAIKDRSTSVPLRSF